MDNIKEKIIKQAQELKDKNMTGSPNYKRIVYYLKTKYNYDFK